MSGVNESRQITATYKEKYKSSGPGNWLRLREGDVFLLYFVGSGDNGDPFFETYMAHEVPPSTPEKRVEYRYCPVLSEHPIPQGYQCQWCGSKVKSKRRMGMWFYVQTILHSSLLQGENFPQFDYKGVRYYREDINDFKRWDTSAWDESPLEDIFMVHMQFGSLRTQRCMLVVTGANLKRRYKIAGEPNTPALPDAYIQKAQEECEPIMSVLQGKLQNDTDSLPVTRLEDNPSMGLPGFGEAPQMAPGFGTGAAPSNPGFQAPASPVTSFGGFPPPADLPPRGQPMF